MTVRELIRYARSHGWQHTVWGAWSDKQHVWESGEWRIEVEVWPAYYRVELLRRWAPGVARPVATFNATAADQLATWLEWIGVLPVLEGAQQ